MTTARTTGPHGLSAELRGFRRMQRLVRRAARPSGGVVAAVVAVPLLRPSAAAGPVGGRTAPRIPGAKFEEILVVSDSADPAESAFWLDDDLPHVRRWAGTEATTDTARKAEGK